MGPHHNPTELPRHLARPFVLSEEKKGPKAISRCWFLSPNLNSNPSTCVHHHCHYRFSATIIRHLKDYRSLATVPLLHSEPLQLIIYITTRVLFLKYKSYHGPLSLKPFFSWLLIFWSKSPLRDKVCTAQHDVAIEHLCSLVVHRSPFTPDPLSP